MQTKYTLKSDLSTDTYQKLDTLNWKYEKHEEDLLIKSGVKGDDLPMLAKGMLTVQQFIEQESA